MAPLHQKISNQVFNSKFRRHIALGETRQALEMLSQGADPNTCEAIRSRPTALMLACDIGDEEVALALIEAGANIHATNQKTRETALMLAVDSGLFEVCKQLVSRGADVHATCKTHPATWRAAVNDREHSMAILDLLVNAGGDINQLNADGETAAFAFTDDEDIKQLDHLVGLGLRLDVVSESGETAAFGPAKFNAIGLLTRMIQYGVDVSQKSNKGQSIFDFLTEQDDIRRVEAALAARDLENSTAALACPNRASRSRL